MTAHIFLIQDTIERFFNVEDLERLFRMTVPKVAVEEDHGQKLAAKMREMIADNATSPAKQSVEDSRPESTTDLSFKFRKYLRSMASNNAKEIRERTLCHKCKDIADDPWVTSCLHVYCKECLHEMSFEASQRGETQMTCLACSEVFESSSPCVGISELEMPDAAFMVSRDGSNRPRGQKSQEENMKWIDVGGKILPSTKTAAVQIQIEQWLRDEPDKKIIVFSQWHLL